MREVQVGDRTIRLEDFSGRKGIRVLRTLEEIAKSAPAIQKRWQDYTRQYEAENTIDLDRAYARSEFGPRPLFTEEPVVNDGMAVTDTQGQPLVRRMPMLDEHGAVRMGPDPLGHLSEQDWAASGNKLKRPRSPSVQEQVMVVFPSMIDLAEKETAALIGLITMTNQDVKHHSRDGSIKDKAAELGDEILDAPIDQIVELMVNAGEILMEQYQEKVVGKLGPRLKSILALFGIRLPAADSKTSSSTTNATSSTDSPSPTDGEKSRPSTEPATAASVA